MFQILFYITAVAPPDYLRISFLLQSIGFDLDHVESTRTVGFKLTSMHAKKVQLKKLQADGYSSLRSLQNQANKDWASLYRLALKRGISGKVGRPRNKRRVASSDSLGVDQQHAAKDNTQAHLPRTREQRQQSRQYQTHAPVAAISLFAKWQHIHCNQQYPSFTPQSLLGGTLLLPSHNPYCTTE